MFKRTLIVLEPQLHPDAVIHHGLAMARACLADVVFYTALSSQKPRAPDLPGREVAAHGASPDDTRTRTERLHRRARQTAEDLGVLSSSVLARSDQAERGILEAAQTSHCDAIMVACDGSNALLRLLNGSFIPGLVTASPLPVMVCPPWPSAGGDPGAALQRILVVLEDGDLVPVAQRQGLALAHELSAELLFVHLKPFDTVPVVDAAEIVACSNDRLAVEIQLQSQRLLASACAAAAKLGLTALGISLPAGTTAKDIARLAAEQACDLIVVANRGRNAVMRLLTGSRIPGLITSAASPVLICRGAEQPPQRRRPLRRLHRHRAAAAAAAARAAHVQGP